MKPQSIPMSKRAEFLRDLWAGFSEPSRLGLLAIAGGFLIMVLVAMWFFSEQTLSGPMGKYLARSQLDSEAFATQRALQIKATPQRHPRLLILGTSATANAIAEERPLAEDLLAETGQEWEVHLLTTPRQSVLDQMTLVETALEADSPGDQPVVIAIGVSLLRQSWDTEDMIKFDGEGRIGLRSAWADAEVAAIGGSPRRRFGFYPLDNYHFVAVNGCEALLRLVLQWPAKRKLDTFAPEASIPPEKRRRTSVAAQVRQGLQDSHAYFHAMDVLLGHLSGRSNVHVVQIEEPVSPGFLQTTDLLGAKQQSDKKFHDYGVQNGMTYLPIVADAGIPDEAYHDDLHIYGKQYQARLRKALARRLSQLVHEGWSR